MPPPPDYRKLNNSERTVEVQKSILGAKNQNILVSMSDLAMDMSDLASFYHLRGQYEQAAVLRKQS